MYNSKEARAVYGRGFVVVGCMLVWLKRKGAPAVSDRGALSLGLAATYSPAGEGSTIGASGLNFSVRDGKRCSPEP